MKSSSTDNEYEMICSENWIHNDNGISNFSSATQISMMNEVR